MSRLRRLLLSLAFALSVVCGSVPTTVLAHHLEEDSGDAPAWNSRAASDNAHTQAQERLQEQRREEEREANQRNEARRRSLYNTPAPSTPKDDNGIGSTNSFNSTTGVFTNCYGTAQTKTCMSTGGQ